MLNIFKIHYYTIYNVKAITFGYLNNVTKTL